MSIAREALPEHAPVAVVCGENILEIPKDLYIPPDAMRILLETFEGPFDLLLYLIRKENIDILNIPIAEVTKQYIQYIEMMHTLSLELAAEYLVMAATLAEIKSRMLLPRPEHIAEHEEDPRAELVRRLQEYERYKKAAQDLDALPRLERDHFVAKVSIAVLEKTQALPQVNLNELRKAIMDVLKRASLNASHKISLDTLSVQEKMTFILSTLQSHETCEFHRLFVVEEGRLGVAVTFLGMLELLKQHLIEFMQVEPFAPIYLRAKAAA